MLAATFALEWGAINEASHLRLSDASVSQSISRKFCQIRLFKNFIAAWWKAFFTTAELAGRFGMVESIGDLPTQCRLRWLPRTCC